MKRFRAVTLGLLLTLGASTSDQGFPRARGFALRITVRFMNYAGVSRTTLQRAKKEATRILRRAEVHTEWLDCSPSAQGGLREPACQRPVGPTTIVLGILPRSMATRRSPRYEKFGYALPAEKGGFGFFAGVFSHRVDELVAWRGSDKASRGTVLGHLMAHEIGHLLLGPESHSATGIMHVPWRPKDLERAAQGRLGFTADQAERIQVQVQARMSADLLLQVD